jgi:eukaryotic-like serine/threonine-protein kinase
VTIQIGDVVGDYRVIGIAGSGGMGAVYRIEHVITKRIEAMKLLPPGMSDEPEQVQRFEREIQVQARLHHPNIVALYNAVRHDNSVALIMEFVEGESLDRVLQSGPLPLKLAVNYASQVLSALAYAHDSGVIHRDVAPANIIITTDGAAKLTDFGLARAETDLRLTSTGVPVGSPWYMSPEQVRGIGTIDHRTDIYAVGAVLHEMLTGVKLFEAGGAFALMRAQVEAVPAPPSSVNPAVPPVLDAIVAKALAKDQTQRFQSANEFRLSLDRALAPVVPQPVAAQPVVPATAQIETEVLPPAAVRTGRWLGFAVPRPAVLAAIAVTPALLLAAGYLAVRPRTNPVRVAPAVSRPAASAIVPQPEPVPEPVQPLAQESVATPMVRPTAPTPLPRSSPVAAAPATLPLDHPQVAPKPAPAPRAARPAAAPQRSFALKVTGAEVLPSGATTTPPAAPPPSPSTEPARPAPPPPVTAELPPTHSAPVAPALVPALEAPPSPDAGPAKPVKGNRFVKALGKINPFKKDEPGAAAPAQEKRN